MLHHGHFILQHDIGVLRAFQTADDILQSPIKEIDDVMGMVEEVI